MRIIYEHWKYIIRNILLVLPFAVVPGIFIALTFDFNAMETFFREFFAGDKLEYLDIFFAWSLFRFDSPLGIIYSSCALISSIVFGALTYIIVEKHMRIGKCTLSGLFSQLKAQILPVMGVVLFYFCLYEVWALVLSAMLYTVSALGATALASILFFVIVLVFVAVLLYLVSIFYLWLPCLQITGMRASSALTYSYRLVTRVRGELILSLLSSFMPVFIILWACSFLPDLASVIITFCLMVFLFMSFTVRMETFYFETDKIDREDLLRSYREL